MQYNLNKIAIIGFTNLYQMPYLKYYTDLFDIKNVNYDVIYWNRFNISEKNDFRCSNYFRFDLALEDDSGIKSKLIAFIKYRKFILSHIKTNNYSKIVVLTTIPSILIGRLLMNNFKNRYIIDIRDFSYENFTFFKYLEKKIFDKAFSVSISSEGFLNFLPKINNYYLSINFNKSNLEQQEEFKNKLLDRKRDRVIRIIYIGAISYFEMNVKFLNHFGNNKNFIISYVGHGPSAKNIKNYCKENDITNVEFVSRFLPSEKVIYYKKSDLIFNLYGNDSLLTLYAISNKLYDAASYYLPILVCEKTQMEKESVKNGFGYTIDFNNKKTAEKLFNWYNNLNKENFIDNCDKYISFVVEKNNNFVNNINKFIEKE